MNHRPRAINEILKTLSELGFDTEFSYAVCGMLDTDFVAERMLRFLLNARPTRGEVVADELVTLIEERNAYRQKHINDYYSRREDMDELFIKSISIDHNSEGFSDTYVSRIPAISRLTEMEFGARITLFTGENGSGKSTMLEAIAIAEGLNPEGGTRNYTFSTFDDFSRLKEAVRPHHGNVRSRWSYFLRAESFYNMASAALNEYNYDGKMKNYHAMSHGESFLEFIQDNSSVGLYIMDEPEAALSPQRQLTLLLHIYRMAKAGSQFIIATHSPILLGMPGAELFSFDGGIHSVTWEETESCRVMKMFIENRERMLERLLQDE